MLIRDPAKRPTIDEILQHEWMAKGGAEAVICRQHPQGPGTQYCELVLSQLGVFWGSYSYYSLVTTLSYHFEIFVTLIAVLSVLRTFL